MKIRILITIIAALLALSPSVMSCDTSGDCCEETSIELDTFVGTCGEIACDKDVCTATDFPEANTGFIPPLCQYELPWHLNGGYAWLCWAYYDSGTVFHPAMDLNKVGGHDTGEPVHASANGYVVDVYNEDDMSVVLIKHNWRGETWYTAYFHMGTIDVEVGDCVCRGQVIGTVGDIGAAGQPHLHFEVRSTEHTDPETAYWWGSALSDADTVASWYRDPLLFTTTHLPYTCDNSSIFRDLSCWHWAYDYWIEVTSRSIFNGTSCDPPMTGTCLFPEQDITRAQLAKVAMRAFGMDVTTPTPAEPFVDSCTSDPLHPYIATLYDKDIVSGYSLSHECEEEAPDCDTGTRRYCPFDSITRAESLKILIEVAKEEGYEITLSSCTVPPFPDVPAGHSLCTYVQAAKNRNFVNGFNDGTFKPDTFTTRSEMAKVVANMLAELDVE